ncbi:MAG: hypothetical protein GY811_16615, partial [Myxococcales bacterium]|nr:hypothetical protein [Myxococcales bacterium]
MRTQLSLALTGALTVLSAAVFTGPASAQSTKVGGNIDINAFRPAIDSRGYVTVNASQVLGHKELSFGLVTNWGKSVLTLEDGTNTYEVSNIITPTLVGAYGLKLGPAELEVGVSFPFHVMNGDRSPDFGDDTPDDPNDDKNFGFEGQGL